jgi:hypothetical protein
MFLFPRSYYGPLSAGLLSEVRHRAECSRQSVIELALLSDSSFGDLPTDLDLIRCTEAGYHFAYKNLARELEADVEVVEESS